MLNQRWMIWLAAMAMVFAPVALAGPVLAQSDASDMEEMDETDEMDEEFGEDDLDEEDLDDLDEEDFDDLDEDDLDEADCDTDSEDAENDGSDEDGSECDDLDDEDESEGGLTVTLTVLTPSGAGAAGAEVIIIDLEEEDAYEMETDAEGVVVFEDVEPGEYIVLVFAPEGSGLMDVEDYIVIEEPGEGEGNEIFLELTLEAGATIMGTLQDAAGSPVMAYVYAIQIPLDEDQAEACYGDFDEDDFDDLEDLDEDDLDELDFEDLEDAEDCDFDFGEAETNSQGVFTLDGLSEGYYLIFAETEDGEEYDLGELYVEQGETADLGLLYATEGASITGTVVTADGSVLEDAWAYITTSDGEILYAEIDEDGTFEIEDVEPGTYTVFIESDDFPTLMSDPVEVGAEDIDLGEIALGGGTVVKGTLKVDGKPLVGAYVAVWNDDDAYAEDITDAQGMFELRGLSAGNWGFYVEADGDEEMYYEVDTDEDGHITIAEGETEVTFDVDVAGPGKITGIVTDAAGKPVAGAEVAAYNDDDGDSAVTDALGRYELVLPEGKYTIEVEAKGAPLYTKFDAATVASGQAATFDVKLSSGGFSVSGTVQDAKGKAAKDVLVLVLLFDENGDVSWTDAAITNAKGAWKLDNVPAGAYTIVAIDDVGAEAEGKVTVASAAVKADTLKLSMEASA